MPSLSLHYLAPSYSSIWQWFKGLWACIVQEISCHDGQCPGARNPPEAMLGCVSQCGKSIKSHEWLENQPSKALPACAAGCSGHICGSHIYESQTHALLFGFQEANNEDAYISLYFCHYLESASTNKSQRTEMQSVQGKNSVANKVQYYLSHAHKIFSEV